MVVTPRVATHFRVIHPYRNGIQPDLIIEPPTEKITWFKLRQFTDVPSIGKSLFNGSQAEKNKLFRQFQNYILAGQANWEAGAKTNGAAASLLYYYGALNLAKGELLRTNPAAILSGPIHHGLTYKPTKSSKNSNIKSDSLEVRKGIFPLLYEKRTGVKLPPGTKIPIRNLLSLIPEIGLEVDEFGRTRPYTALGQHTIANDLVSAWSLIATHAGSLDDQREELTKRVSKNYDLVDLANWSNWREFFAFSVRLPLGAIQVYQSKESYSFTREGTSLPNVSNAAKLLQNTLGPHLGDPINYAAEFITTHSLMKSKPLVIPVDLARYAAMFYLSSLVRYNPASLDAKFESKQAWLMNSLAQEVPLNLLIGALIGIRGGPVYFEANGYRV